MITYNTSTVYPSVHIINYQFIYTWIIFARMNAYSKKILVVWVFCVLYASIILASLPNQKHDVLQTNSIIKSFMMHSYTQCIPILIMKKLLKLISFAKVHQNWFTWHCFINHWCVHGNQFSDNHLDILLHKPFSSQQIVTCIGRFRNSLKTLATLYFDNGICLTLWMH